MNFKYGRVEKLVHVRVQMVMVDVDAGTGGDSDIQIRCLDNQIWNTGTPTLVSPAKAK
jgi:hypothetical protein